MFQSLTTSALSSAVPQAAPDSLDVSDGTIIVAILVSLVALVVGVVNLFRAGAAVVPNRVTKTPAGPRSRRKLGAQPSTQRLQNTEPPPSSRRRRLIVLYDVTPGQTPYEYNVGDSAGTRGAAPAFGRAR